MTILAWLLACATAPGPSPRPTIAQCAVETDLLARFERLAAEKFSLRIRPTIPVHHGKTCRTDKQCGRGGFCTSLFGLPRRVCRKVTTHPVVTTTLQPTP